MSRQKILSYETSKALFDAGARLETELASAAIDPDGMGTFWSATQFAKAYQTHVIPRPDLPELLNALIGKDFTAIEFQRYKKPDGSEEGYSTWIGHHDHTVVKRHTSPVEAAGLLLLELYQQGILKPETGETE